MTREKNLFTSIEYDNIPKKTIIFGDNSKGEIIGLGKITLAHDNSITNVYLVETLGVQFVVRLTTLWNGLQLSLY